MISLWISFYFLHGTPNTVWWLFPAVATATLAVMLEFVLYMWVLVYLNLNKQ